LNRGSTAARHDDCRTTSACDCIGYAVRFLLEAIFDWTDGKLRPHGNRRR
jgi:hypothetical protein